jgi:phage shock protein A
MFSRFLNAIRGVSSEAGDAVMDTNVMQNAEIRGATDKMESDLSSAKQNEAKIGGMLNTAKRELGQLKEKYKVTENAVRKALEKEDEEKAMEFASDAEAIQLEVDCKQTEVDQFQGALTAQKKNIGLIKNNLKMVQRETKGLQAQKAVGKARKSASASVSAVSGEDSSNALSVIRKQREKISAESDKLDYVEEQQSSASAEVSATDYMKESSGTSLLDKLKAEKNA